MLLDREQVLVLAGVAGLQLGVLGLELLHGDLELVELPGRAVQRVLLLAHVDVAAVQLPLQLRGLPERSVLLLLEVADGVGAEAADLLQRQRQAIHRAQELADPAVLGADLLGLRVELCLLPLGRLAQTARGLVLLPQIRLGPGELADQGLAVGAPKGGRDRLEQGVRRAIPGVPIPGQALRRRARLADPLRLGDEPLDQLTQGASVAGLDEPARPVLDQIGGDHLTGRGDDRQTAAQVVHLPERQVDLALRVARHEVERHRGASVLVPELIDGDQATEAQPRMILGERPPGVGVVLRVRADPVLAAVQIDGPGAGVVQHADQVQESRGEVCPRPEDAARHQAEGVGGGRRRQVGRAGDGHDRARVRRDVHTREGEQRQMEVLLPLIAEQELVRPLERVQDPHRLAGVVGAGLELLLEHARGEEVEEHGPGTVRDPARLLEGLDEHDVGLHPLDDGVQLVGLGECERVAWRAERAAEEGEARERGPPATRQRRLHPWGGDDVVVGQPRGGQQGAAARRVAGCLGEARDAARWPRGGVAPSRRALAQALGEILVPRAVEDGVSDRREGFTVGECAQSGAHDGAPRDGRHSVEDDEDGLQVRGLPELSGNQDST